MTKECSQCGKELPKYEGGRPSPACKECYPAYRRAINLFYCCKQRAAKRNLPFDLDINWIHERILAHYCEVTGLPFQLYNNGNNYGNRHSLTPSVDRIIPAKGYLKSNCRLVIWWYNMAKYTYNDLETWHLCNAVANCSLEKLVPFVNEKDMTNTEII